MRIFCSYIHIANRVEIRSIENIDIPFGNELVSFHACLEKKKKKNSSKIGTSLPRGKFSLRFHPSNPLFIFIYTLFRKGQNRNINRKGKIFYTYYTCILEFYLPYFSSNFFFLYISIVCQISTMTDCVLLKDSLPPKKIPPACPSNEVAL